MDFSFSANDEGIIRMPCLIKGRLEFAPELSIATILAAFSQRGFSPVETATLRVGDAFVIRQPGIDRATLQADLTTQYLTFAAPNAEDLLETDLIGLSQELYQLPVSAVLEYIAGLRSVLEKNRSSLLAAARSANATSPQNDRALELIFEQLPGFLDADALGEGIDRELSVEGFPGRTLLDNWIDVPARTHSGFTANIRESIFDTGQPAQAAPKAISKLRAIPTRQLHIAAGNSPMVLITSLLRAIATKGAAIIKCPHENTLMGAVLASAMVELDPHHPITRHTSIVYWPGGDAQIENTLLSSSHIDRVIVWGSPETVAQVKQKTTTAKALFLNPRFGLSMIGNSALTDPTLHTAILAASDSMVANQQACTSSLVHYVEGTQEQALDYCKKLQGVLKRWDSAIPHAVSRSTLGQLRALRRGAFLNGTWFINGPSPQIHSAVVYMPEPVDLALHPMSRLIIVRRVDDLLDVITYLNPSVSTVGIYPPERIKALRDIISATGVSNVFRLGDIENVYTGIPHDGMRILSELVNWVNA
ncbi:MAG: hypothetical protein O2868_13390 [Proteobacteria bacterium]|jgi:hypothetical protein|nr:hypothetical protein [Pseudomonadota bacterium]